jgi:nitrite reductase/ring-hydroxylating ferredoxin subunit
MNVPDLDLEQLGEVPFALVTHRELRRRRLVPVEALGRKLVVVWNRGKPRVYEDSCPHLGLPMSLGRYQGDRLTCSYHGWSFDAADGSVLEQPTLSKALPCRLIRLGCLVAGDLVFAWLGPLDAEERVRAVLPEHVLSGMSCFSVEFETPYYLALFSSVDMAHYSFHTGYRPLYSIYRLLRDQGAPPGGAFAGEVVEETDHRVTIRVESAGRTIHLYASATEMDDGSVNFFQSYVTPISPTRTRYWECYRPRGGRLTNLIARATFMVATRHLITGEDKLWTGASRENFLSGRNIHMSKNDLPLGVHLRKFVLPRMRGAQVTDE